jgi:hypothetical protein
MDVRMTDEYAVRKQEISSHAVTVVCKVRAREAVARYVHATGVGGRVRFGIALYSGFAQGYWDLRRGLGRDGKACCTYKP